MNVRIKDIICSINFCKRINAKNIKNLFLQRQNLATNNEQQKQQKQQK